MPFCWQGICGGLEDNETEAEGARREIMEEAGVMENLPLYPLESASTFRLIFLIKKHRNCGEKMLW